MRRERELLLEGGDGRCPRTVHSFLLPVALAVLVAKSSFLAYPREMSLSRTVLLGQHLRAPARKHSGRQRLIQVAVNRLTSLAEDPDEALLRAQMGRGWVHRGDAHVGSSPGGPGMPLTASYAMTPEELKHQQFEKVIRQRQFDDMVVDGRTGVPIDLTEEQKKILKKHMLEDEAREQEDVDAMSDPFKDSHVPSQFIYPDGESIIPKDYFVKTGGLVDKHVMANGTITDHEGPLGGIFREGAFGNVKQGGTTFNKIGESMGFTDRPLAIRDVDYEQLRRDRLKGIELRDNETEAFRLARINGTEHKYYCSGSECDDQWGVVGDQVVDLRTGEHIREDVGPGDHLSPDQDYWALDRHFDPHTGVELNNCVGPQCSGFQWGGDDKPLIVDKYEDSTTGHGNFGGAYPADGTTDPQLIREHQRAHDGPMWDGQDPNQLTYEPYAADPRMRARYDRDQHKTTGNNPDGSWSKDWNAGSWVGYIILGPVLTVGVCTFVFMTRGVVWGIAVLGGLVGFDILMYYFG